MNNLLLFWEQRSPRERRLAMIVVLLLLLFMGYMVATRVRIRLQQQDLRITQLEETLLNRHRLLAYKEAIAERYSQVAAQHSSDWDDAEILNRLRLEIYRLAQKNPPPVQADGKPTQLGSPGGHLITIPELRAGKLYEIEGGYREYQLALDIPQAPLKDLLEFLKRLQNSPQSLRIDRLELFRAHVDQQVKAKIQLTRIIVPGVIAQETPLEKGE